MATSSEQDPDRELMLAVQVDRPGAFEEFVHRYSGLLLDFFQRQLGERSAAEDLAQDTFLRIFRARSRYRPLSRVRTYVLTIATNLCINFQRSRELRRTLPLETGSDEHASRTPADSSTQPADRLESAETAIAVRRAVAALPENQRMAIDLLRFGELSYAEIAATLGITLAATKSLIHRAQQNLRVMLADHLPSHPDSRAIAASNAIEVSSPKEPSHD